MTGFRSTRRGGAPVPFSVAMVRGLAPDGGLYVPDVIPVLDAGASCDATDVVAVGERVLSPFLVGDRLEGRAAELCTDAFNFALPLTDLGERDAVLELFHGPTAAFKDVGARFLAQCLRRLDDSTRTVLVATSGDTGGAVAAAFHRMPGIRVGILFPAQGVSDRQRHQLTCWGDNVHSFAVRGSFDDCQALLKAAFADPAWQQRNLTTANSINVGRLLPQVVYYASAALRYQRAHGGPAGFIVPSGNVGNATAALWARRMGFPVRELVMATNENRAVVDYLQGDGWRPRPSVATLANAMDVGNPSNMERVLDLYPTVSELARDVRAVAVTDAEIERTIAAGPERHGRVWDPHTATAVRALESLDDSGWVVVATAHPAKFPGVVEPLVGHAVEMPPALAELLARPSRCVEIEPELAAVEAALA